MPLHKGRLLHGHELVEHFGAQLDQFLQLLGPVLAGCDLQRLGLVFGAHDAGDFGEQAVHVLEMAKHTPEANLGALGDRLSGRRDVALHDQLDHRLGDLVLAALGSLAPPIRRAVRNTGGTGFLICVCHFVLVRLIVAVDCGGGGILYYGMRCVN